MAVKERLADFLPVRKTTGNSNWNVGFEKNKIKVSADRWDGQVYADGLPPLFCCVFARIHRALEITEPQTTIWNEKCQSGTSATPTRKRRNCHISVYELTRPLSNDEPALCMQISTCAINNLRSSWCALSFGFWVRSDQVKRWAANGRGTRRRSQRHLLTLWRFGPISGPTPCRIELDTKDSKQGSSTAIERCAAQSSSHWNEPVILHWLTCPIVFTDQIEVKSN